MWVFLNVLVLKQTQKEKNLLGQLLLILQNRLAGNVSQTKSGLYPIWGKILLEYSHTH